MQKVSLSTKFGWTPDEIDKISFEDKLIYLSVLKGMGMAEHPKLRK